MERGNLEFYFEMPMNLLVSAAFGDSWTKKCQKLFETIIGKLTSAPVLGFVDYSAPFVLHTDASLTGLGAALYQEQEGKLMVIAYASRGLSKSEVNYPAHKLEFLALKWCVTEKFHDYMYGLVLPYGTHSPSNSERILPSTLSRTNSRPTSSH